jgi:quercetin dioxygenase-like cupin family protein
MPPPPSPRPATSLGCSRSPGDVFTIPAGTWHWHGAARDTAACHISIRQPGQTNWDVAEHNWAAGYEN